jgi:hypothetical protein
MGRDLREIHTCILGGVFDLLIKSLALMFSTGSRRGPTGKRLRNRRYLHNGIGSMARQSACRCAWSSIHLGIFLGVPLISVPKVPVLSLGNSSG